MNIIKIFFPVLYDQYREYVVKIEYRHNNRRRMFTDHYIVKNEETAFINACNDLMIETGSDIKILRYTVKETA